MTKFYDAWSNRVFEADIDDILRIIDSISDGVYDEISNGRPVNKVDIMNDFYRQIGLPEDNSYPKEQFYFNNKCLKWTLFADLHEGDLVIKLDSYFE